ncbi:MAG: ATP-binding cassette domain-containing protein [Candidatus Tokpelaia sp.]|nr:MAG: ATP-binding cassette domain-containing protein [Candidatus Tokpelaia sp.]
MPKAENSTNISRRRLTSLRILRPYLCRYKYLAVIALAALVLAAMIMLALPLSVRRMMDYGFSSTGNHFINSYFAMLIVLAALLALASAIRYYSTVNLGEKIIADLRCDVFAHLTQLSPAFYDRSNSGEILSRLTADTTQVKTIIGASLSVSLRNAIMAAGAVLMMVFTSPRLSAYVLLAIPVIIVPLVALARKVRASARKAQDKQARANALALEQIGAIRTVWAYNQQNNAVKSFTILTEAALKAVKNSTVIRAVLTGFAIFLIFGSVIAVLWLGARDVLNGHMSAGTLGQFVLYAIFAAAAFGQLSETGGEISAAGGALERLAEILAEKPLITAPAAAEQRHLPALTAGEKTGRQITLDNICFTYPSRPAAALERLSFTVQPGETVALVGPSGAGKSTILALLLRFYDPQSGQIRLDTIDITALDPQELRAQFAYVAQGGSCFSGTVRANIAFGAENAAEEAIIAAAKAANAYEFIQNLPQGFDTKIGEKGARLSGGQQQRLAIARALLRNAPVLLLDEATSALDAESETLIQAALSRVMRNRTTLVIAHRLATVQQADRILVLQNGQIIEEGNHADLTAQNGLYARLARLQFRKNSARH